MIQPVKHYLPKGPRLLLDFSTDGRDSSFPYRLKLAIRSAIQKALCFEGFSCDAEVSVTLCDNEVIRSLNKTYRQKDSATDVLSFPMYEADELAALKNCGECIPLGDIVISRERAAEQAKELGNSFLREVAFLSVHSTLHLLGYDHERSPREDELMCQKQRKIITAWEEENTL